MSKEQLKQQIENEAEYKASLQFHKKYSTDQWQACVITYRQGATEYASKWQAAEERAARAEKALREIKKGLNWIENSRELDIIHDALTPKTGSDE